MFKLCEKKRKIWPGVLYFFDEKIPYMVNSTEMSWKVVSNIGSKIQQLNVCMGGEKGVENGFSRFVVKITVSEEEFNVEHNKKSITVVVILFSNYLKIFE